MSTVKKKTKQQKGKAYATRCSHIIGQFNDPSKPLGTRDFKNMLFFCLHDSIIHGDESALNDKHVATIYFLWDILDQIEELERMKS